MTSNKLTILLCGLMLACTLLPAHGAGVRVLVLNSYHPQYTWTSEIVRGVRYDLEQDIDKEQLYIEFMDTRRHQDDREHEQRLFELYRYKFRNTRFDAILCSDDAALDFMLRYRNIIFPGVPVVFCGVNKYDPTLVRYHDFMTGIFEGTEIEGNLQLIFTLHPHAKKVVLLTDQTSLGEEMTRVAEETLGRLNPRVACEIWNTETFDELIRKASLEPADTVFFLMAIVRTADGRYFSYTNDTPKLDEAIKGPLYGMWGMELGRGIVGGLLNDPFVHGQQAAAMVRAILNGTPPADIPMQQKASYQPAFDFQQLQALGIPMHMLPPASRIVNRPEGILRRYALPLAGIVVFVAFQTLLLGLLISDRHKLRLLNSELRVNQDRLALTMEGSPLRLWELRVSEQLFILHDQPALLSAEDAITFHLQDVLQKLHPEDRPRVAGELDEFLYGLKNVFESEFRLRLRGNREASSWVVVHGRIVERTADGHAELVRGTMLDVSDIKQKEMLLLQAQKMETIGNLASGLAHDFNNVLSTVTGCVSLINFELEQHGLDRSDVAEYLDTIATSAQRAGGLVRQLMSLSSRSQETKIPININDSIHHVLILCRNTFDRSIQIVENPYPEIAAIMGDPVQIEQLLLNLCLNAAHAMTIMRPVNQTPGGVLKVSVFSGYPLRKHDTFRNAIPETVYWRIDVADTGVGIAPDLMGKIFDPFFTTKQEGKGTGLGLAMVYNMVKAHHGFIDISSNPGSGSIFHIYLPGIEPRSYCAETDDKKNQADVVCGEGEVLIVSHERSISAVLKEMLIRCGYFVVVAQNVQEAMVLCRERANMIDLVMVDLDRSEHSGFVFIGELERMFPAWPVVVLTRTARQSISKQGANIRGILYKPFSLGTVSHAVADAIGGMSRDKEEV